MGLSLQQTGKELALTHPRWADATRKVASVHREEMPLVFQVIELAVHSNCLDGTLDARCAALLALACMRPTGARRVRLPHRVMPRSVRAMLRAFRRSAYR